MKCIHGRTERQKCRKCREENPDLLTLGDQLADEVDYFLRKGGIDFIRLSEALEKYRKGR